MPSVERNERSLWAWIADSARARRSVIAPSSAPKTCQTEK
jgi:hypothetical protein